MSDRCSSCGRKIYHDANVCDRCRREQERYNGNSANDNTCGCGNSKYPDAIVCETCWEKQSAWDR